MEQELITAIQNRAWWPVVGIACTLLLGAFRTVAPNIWASIPTRWKPLPAILVIIIASVVDAFSSGVTWQVALVMVALQTATGAPTAVGMADTILRLSGGKQPSLASIAPVALVLMLSGCAFLRKTAPEAAGAAASRATLVCQALKGSDRDTCTLIANVLEENNELVEEAVRNAVEGQACPAPSASAQ
jgi:hypothetical protein